MEENQKQKMLTTIKQINENEAKFKIELEKYAKILEQGKTLLEDVMKPYRFPDMDSPLADVWACMKDLDMGEVPVFGAVDGKLRYISNVGVMDYLAEDASRNAADTVKEMEDRLANACADYIEADPKAEINDLKVKEGIILAIESDPSGKFQILGYANPEHMNRESCLLEMKTEKLKITGKIAASLKNAGITTLADLFFFHWTYGISGWENVKGIGYQALGVLDQAVFEATGLRLL